MAGSVTVKLFDPDGSVVGEVLVDGDAPVQVTVRDERSRGRVEALAAHLARPRSRPPRPTCADDGAARREPAER